MLKKNLNLMLHSFCFRGDKITKSYSYIYFQFSYLQTFFINLLINFTVKWYEELKFSINKNRMLQHIKKYSLPYSVDRSKRFGYL